MGITLTPQEKAQLQREDSLILPLPGADGVESATFHNPDTGQEFFGLPVDPYHLSRSLKRGLRMGPASLELKAKWEDNEPVRQAENDALMAKHAGSIPEENTPRFTDAVADAVTQVLEKLGVEVPNEERQAHPQEEEAEKIEYDVQLPLLVPTDAPSESETKLVVSQASQPELHLVE